MSIKYGFNKVLIAANRGAIACRAILPLKN